MVNQQEIETFVVSELEGTEHFLVEIEFVPGSKISIYADSFESFTIDDCMELSRSLKKKFGEELDDYDIMVSSAGIDRPFKTMKQYHKNIGKEVKVVMLDGKSVSGILNQVQENAIFVEELPKPAKKGMKISKTAVSKMHELPYERIKETKRVINF